MSINYLDNPEVKEFIEKQRKEQEEFDKKYPTEKDKLIHYILNSINVNDIEEEELKTWNEQELSEYLGLCYLIEEERQEIADGTHWLLQDT